MNQILHPDSSSEGPWHTSDHPRPVPDTSTWPELGASVSATEDALHVKTGPLADMRSEWIESLRTKVRGNPLACVAAAVTLGAVIARYARGTR